VTYAGEAAVGIQVTSGWGAVVMLGRTFTAVTLVN
jgi:hypothetical protein